MYTFMMLVKLHSKEDVTKLYEAMMSNGVIDYEFVEELENEPEEE